MQGGGKRYVVGRREKRAGRMREARDKPGSEKEERGRRSKKLSSAMKHKDGRRTADFIRTAH